jgi:hypothetical protein
MSPGFLCCHDFHLRHPGVSPGRGASYEEAARVCFDQRYGRSPIQLAIERGPARTHAWVAWTHADDQLNVAWRNAEEITEHAAYGVALAVLETLYGMIAVRGTEVKTGADFYVARREASRANMEKWLRLEVAGVGLGNYRALHRQLRKKVRQLRHGRSNLPGLVCVVGFESKWVLIEDVVFP